jgi:hypothetical protein
MISKASDLAATCTAGSLAIGGAKISSSEQSLLNSSLVQVFSGDFTIYASDIISVGGFVFLIVNICFGYSRMMADRSK